MQRSSESKRLVMFDVLRVVLTIFVVNLHIRIITATKANVLEQFVFFVVPLFLVLSFFLMYKYFSQQKLALSSLLKRISRLLLPLLAWSAVGFLLHPNLINFKNIALQIVSGGVVNVPLYYLDLLILFTFIFWLITYIPQRFRTLIYVMIILLAFFLEYSGINYHFFSPMIETVKKGYGRFVELIKFASLGLLFAQIDLRFKSSKIYLFALLTISLIISFLNLPIAPGYHYSGIPLFAATTAIFSLILVLKNLSVPSPISKWISLLGKYSFGVYLSHYVILELILFLIPSLKLVIALHSLLFLCLFVVFCYGFCLASNKITSGKLSALFV
jgi:peptidoglycan/LPS O-acetylase OafA/YrhL